MSDLTASNSKFEIQIKFGERNVKTSFPFLVVLTLVMGICMGGVLTALFGLGKQNSANTNTALNSNKEITSLDEFYDTEYVQGILKTLNENYIKDVDESREIDYGVIKGYIDGLGDKYTSFLTPEEAESYLEGRTTEFEGVGIILTFNNGFTQVETVIEGNPAEKAGVLAKDYIKLVDETNVEGMQPYEVAKLIRGEKGTDVRLTLLRQSTSSEQYDEVVLSIVRDSIEVDNINWVMEKDNIARIDISQFVDDSVEEFKSNWDDVVSEVSKKDVDGIILDLRNNPGGYVEGVKYILEEFLPEDSVLMQEKSNTGQVTKFYDDREGEFEDIDLVVLVNEGSASASEIFASSIQDNKRGEVVGMGTVGKGVEQRILPLADGSMLIVVFQQWLTPSGNEISEKSPIKPDFVVERTSEDYSKGLDPQKTKATDLLLGR